MNEQIILEPEQDDLLIELAEAARNVPREQRQKFMFLQHIGGNTLVHPGLVEKRNVYSGDIEELAHAGLLNLAHMAHGLNFDVNPRGFKYYEWLKGKAGEPVQRVTQPVHKYLEAETFQRNYQTAYQKWSNAEALLWGSDTESQLTTIGHLCREAMQEFATALVKRFNPPSVESDVTKTVARIKSVISQRSGQLGGKEKAFLDALVAYWGTLNDLVQRQEHGSKREGEILVWEDARRVVFQTVIVMFEIDKSLSRPH